MKKLLGTIILISVLLSALLLALPAQAAPNTVERYGYTTITEPNVKYVYEQLRDAMLEPTPPEGIELADNKKVNVDELKKAYMLFVSDYPECFWLSNAYNYSHIEGNIVCIYPKYSFEGVALTEAKIALESAVSDIMRGLPDASNYDKVLYLHDALAKHVTYEFYGHHQTAYGALVAGKAVCAGYASAYQLLLNRAGINAWNVSGEAIQQNNDPIAHAWNVVWIEKGVCVYTDVTWDDTDNDIFHYYFGVSKDEMSVDHMVDTAVFTLPACNHTDRSYFDVNDRTVTDSTTMQELAQLFGDAKLDRRDAVVCYQGNDPEAFLDRMHEEQDALYAALEVQSGTRGYRLTRVANEIHISVTGNFEITSYAVNIKHGDTVKTYGESEQYVKIGTSMAPIRFFASEGYYFPKNYTAKAINGISIIRINAREIAISGTPTADTEISLPSASATRKAEKPNVRISANARGGATLSGVEAGMKYSFDAVNWTDITSSKEIELNGINVDTVYVIKSGNGEDIDDSDIQIITVPELISPIEDTSGTEGSAGKDNEYKPAATPKLKCGMSVGGTAFAIIVSIAACGAMIRKKR